MKSNFIKYIGLGCASAAMFLTSCEDFLDRPTVDNFVVNSYYQNEAQVKSTATALYSFPWFNWQRGMLAVGDALGGNYWKGKEDVYTIMNMGGAAGDENLIQMSEALWAIIAQANSNIYNIKNYSKASKEVNDKYIGEITLMKACAYFYLVRSWGDIPIVYDNAAIIASGDVFNLVRYKKADVYKYIIATAQEAERLLPETCEKGRLDKSSARGLLSKVYLTAAGVSGQLNEHYLEQAIKYGEMVYDDANHKLEPTYANLFRISTGDGNPEGLIQFHWIAVYNPYTGINMQHCDLVPGASFNGTGSGWGQWTGASVDLLDCFGEDPLVYGAPNSVREVKDPRRLACATMYQDYQPLWYRNTKNVLGSNGFYVSAWNTVMDEEWGFAEFQSPTGALAGQKNIHGHVSDHQAENGQTPQEQGSCTPIYYLRAADVYLCMAEAQLLKDGALSGKCLDAFNAVYKRALGKDYAGTIDYDVIWNERRKELAFEGDMWFNFVKRSYYNLEDATTRALNVERGRFENMSLKDWYEGTLKDTPGFESAAAARESGLISVKATTIPQNQMGDKFTIPFPEKDLMQNPRLREAPADYDFSAVDYYDESKI